MLFAADRKLYFVDNLTGIRLLLAIDPKQTAGARSEFHALMSLALKSAAGFQPRNVGLLETLQLAKELLFNVPNDVVILAIEEVDCLTLGGKMYDAVESAARLQLIWLLKSRVIVWQSS